MANSRGKIFIYGPECLKDHYNDVADKYTVLTELGSDTEDKSHLDTLYASQEDLDLQRKAHFEEMFAAIEKDFEGFNNLNSENQQMIDQVNWRLASVLVCNGLFLTANFFCSPEESYKYEFYLSTLLPVLISLLDIACFDRKGLDVFCTGALSGYFATELKRQGVPFWVGPAVTVTLATALTDSMSKPISTVCEKISKTVSNNMNNVFNFWYRELPKTTSNVPENNNSMQSKRK